MFKSLHFKLLIEISLILFFLCVCFLINSKTLSIVKNFITLLDSRMKVLNAYKKIIEKAINESSKSLTYEVRKNIIDSLFHDFLSQENFDFKQLTYMNYLKNIVPEYLLKFYYADTYAVLFMYLYYVIAAIKIFTTSALSLMPDVDCCYPYDVLNFLNIVSCFILISSGLNYIIIYALYYNLMDSALKGQKDLGLLKILNSYSSMKFYMFKKINYNDTIM